MMKVGVIGCGNIAGAYFENARRMPAIEMVACADLDHAKAEAKAEAYGVRAVSVEDLLSDPSMDIVLNITVPGAHFDVSMAALHAGKHVYNEKPLTVSREDGAALMALADQKGLRVGCAPDTFLGAGYQTVRKIIESGAIGDPVSVTAFMLCPGHESWHPNPFFYYDHGGGPMFDMGPYYLTALVHLLGPVKRVTGTTSAAQERRLVTSQPCAGQYAEVKVPTHVQGLMEFESGAVGSIVTSFDVQQHTLPHIQIYGTKGTLTCPDPNGFGGPIQLWNGTWSEAPLEFPNEGNSRSLGIADMADAIEKGRAHRASGALAFHVLDIMHAFHDSASTGQHVALSGSGVQPAPMPAGLGDGEVG